MKIKWIFLTLIMISITGYTILLLNNDHKTLRKSEAHHQQKLNTYAKDILFEEWFQLEEVPSTEPIIICIDPGHQEKANLTHEPIGPGAMATKYKVTGGTRGAVTKKPEYILTLEASLILKEKLENKGYKVIMTRTSHKVNISNKERAEIANNHQADYFIRIHADGSTNPNTNGFSILTPGKSNPYTDNIFEESYQLATVISKSVKKSQLTKVNGIIERDDISGFNWSQVPAILIELGFMTNPKDDQNLSDEQYLTELIDAIVDGISIMSEDE